MRFCQTQQVPWISFMPEKETRLYVLHYETAARLKGISKFKLHTFVINVICVQSFHILRWFLVTTLTSPQVSDGGDGFQIRREAANILHNQSRASGN
jgi:hypothetical protein